ncbi:MAG: FxDxF family PEP-CTERM protein [Pseudomonadota bacterium]|nr:FxDxF family PEP-CTERM protein [Pseudomonadota bacterium]
MKKTLKYALLLAGMTSLPAMAHIGYGGRNFGTFDDTYAMSTLSGKAATGNYGWIDGTDADNGDSHKLQAYRFTLLESTNVTLSFQEATSQVTDHLDNVSTSQLGLMPGFSLYQGLAHVAPQPADHDGSDISKANRPDYAEGSFKALTDWSIGNEPGDLNGMPIPASLSFFKYIGHANDGTGFGADGMADGKVTHTFMNLAAGDYSVFVGGSDYLTQDISNPNLLTKYGVTGTLVAGVVPEPETYAMLLAGLGLMGAIARRRRPAGDR